MRSFVIVACLLALTNAVVLRNATKLNVSVAAAVAKDGKAEVAELRSQLQKISAGLSAMLDPKGAIAKTKVAESLQAFTTELATTLKETANATDTTKAIKQLQDAKGGVKILMRDLTTQQMRLMKENEDQQESLLLGVLMTRQKESIDKQMEVLNSSEFKNLPVVAAIVAAKDNKTPLFKQVAKYLDKKSGGGAMDKAKALKVDRNGKRDLSSIIDPLNTRIEHLKDADKHRSERHTLEMHKIDEKLKNATSSMKHRLESMKKKSERQFKKDSLLGKSDISSLESAVTAIKKGDMVALKKAQDALQAHLKAMQGHTDNGFIYFIQLAHQMDNRDCPYCAAQCIEKCSANGKSYADCLTDCADAGK